MRPNSLTRLTPNQDDTQANLEARAHELEVLSVALRSKPMSYVKGFVEKGVRGGGEGLC